MTISERIFERLRQLDMTQKEFAKESGIQQSTISEWKKNKTNPSSDKILAICKALDVTPTWLLSGVDPAASRGKNHEYYVVEAGTDTGELVSAFNQLDKDYANKYGESSGFGTYITNNKDKLNKIYVAEIEKTTKEDDNIIFKCYDGERNVFYIQYSSSNYLDILIQFSNIML